LTYALAVSVGANTASLVEFPCAQVAVFDHPQPATTHIRKELASLQDQLRDLEQEIRAVKGTVYGLAVVFGQEVVPSELLELVYPRRRTNVRGLSNACKLALVRAAQPCSLATVCQLVTEIDPTLLAHHRNPRASTMSALRNLARQGDVIRRTKNGRSAWQWVNWDRPGSATEI
jgi:hypothetical protein